MVRAGAWGKARHGGHGAFRLGLVRFGWIRSGKTVEFRSVESGSDQKVLVWKECGKAVEVCSGLARQGDMRLVRARQGGSVLGWCGALWSGRVGRGRFWLGGLDKAGRGSV